LEASVLRKEQSTVDQTQRADDLLITWETMKMRSEMENERRLKDKANVGFDKIEPSLSRLQEALSSSITIKAVPLACRPGLEASLHLNLLGSIATPWTIPLAWGSPNKHFLNKPNVLVESKRVQKKQPHTAAIMKLLGNLRPADQSRCL
jgi:hypothetical protein